MAVEPMQSKLDQHRLSGFIILFSLFLLFFNLGGRSIEVQDNFRFAEIGREILETGDWVMMHNLGGIYVDKPPLHTWSIALSYRLFGLNATSARLPSALFGIVGVLALLYFGMGVEKENPRLGIYAALFLASCYGYGFYARTCRNDITYSVLFSLSLIAFYMGYESVLQRHRVMGYLLFWTLMGAAFLVKGPAAFLTVLIVAVFLICNKGRGPVGYKTLFGTSAALFVVISSWLIPLRLHPDFGQYLELLKTTTILTRRAGPLFYFPAFAEKFFPGSIFLLISLPVLWASRGVLKENPRMRFCLVWAGVYILALHLTRGKDSRYLIPSFFPVSILAAWGVQNVFGGFFTRYGRLTILAGVMVGLICLAVPAGAWVYGGWSWKPLLFALASLGAFLFALRYVRETVILICIFYALGILSFDLFRTAASHRESEQLQLYQILQKEDIPAEEVLIYRAHIDGLDFYFNKILDRSNATLDLRRGVKAIVTHAAGLDEVSHLYGAPVKVERIADHEGKGKGDFFVVIVSPRL